MLDKKTLIIGSIIIVALATLVLAEVIGNIPSEIEIEKMRYSELCVEVWIKGYDRHTPCIEYKDFNTTKQFEDKLKLIIADIDELILNPPQSEPLPNLDKFDLVVELNGSIISKD